MAGYSATPLYKKLGIKQDFQIYLHNPPPNYLALLEGLPSNVLFRDSLENKVDLIHIFTNSHAELSELLSDFRYRIHDAGSIWVSWYKKASKLPTEITEDDIRTAALKIGLVDIKVCAIDELWSGLKLVIRKENRKSAK